MRIEMNLADQPRFQAAIDRFDALNAADPNQIVENGISIPKELAYARRMTAWLDRIDPGASEPLKLAARAQHLMRWKIPRSSFPMDRPGYLRWRTKLSNFHADRAADVLRDVGYDVATIARVRSLIRKEQLKADAQVQTLEDAACLVFLESELADFARHHEEAKLINILRRTWQKMSAPAREIAMGLPLAAEVRQLIARAVAPPTGAPPATDAREA